MVIVAVWIIDRFLGIFLQKKKQTVLSVTLWAVFMIFQFFLEMHVGTASVWNTLINISMIFLISITSYHQDKKFNLYIVMLLWVVWALLEMLVFYCMGMLPMERQDTHMAGAAISKILMIITVYLLSVYWKKKNNKFIPVSYDMVLLLIPAGSMYIAVNEFTASQHGNSIIAPLVTFSILLCINVIVFEIYAKLAENFMLENEKTVYEQQLYMISRNTEEQKKMMEGFREERHNFINKLIVLKDDMEHREKERALEELNRLMQELPGKSIISNCGNSTVDALINFKNITAEKAGVAFRLKIFIPANLPINQCDLGVVMGNALDNAIEAAEQYDGTDKFVEIIMGVKKEALVLTIKNPFCNEIRKDKQGNLLSTKSDGNRHGYGVKSIRRVAEKYNGEVLIETEKQLFLMTVIMNLEQF
jgi:hypothetical protein